ncbi:MAG TPA: right-handed parallel beta-helix repeat-containing protein [Gemmatimonadales bacterium]|nr:right-handed parallel beta-helix repeat-containing protein [Gemmatimonadales bacterium]
MSDALTGPQTAAVSLRFTGDSVLVLGDTVAFGVSADIDGTPLAAPRFQYTIEDTLVAARTASGDSIVARRRGRTRLIASLTSPLLPNPPTLTVALDVVIGVVTVVPANDTLASIEDTLVLAAPAFDAHDLPISGIVPVWISSDTTVAVFVAPGRLVARRNGQVLVRALVDNDTGTGSVVVAQRLARLQASPSVLVLNAFTAESTVVAGGLDARGHPVGGVPISWASDAATIASVTPAGRVRAVDNGTTRIIAQSGSLRDSVTTVVEQQAKQVVILPDPVPAIVALGDQVSLAASATDSLGFVVTVPNKSPGWATLDPTIATVDRNGLVTGVGVGMGRLVAVIDAARDTIAVNVGDLPASIVLQPPSATLASLKDTLLLSATVRNSRGNLIQNPTISWRASDPAITRVDTVPQPLAVAVGVGTVRVIAVAGSVADTSLVTVTNAPAFLNIVPTVDTLTSIWDSLPVPAVILNARGDTLAPTSVQWSSDAPLVGSVDGSGLVVARDTGRATVRAKYARAPGDTLRDSIAIRVFNLPASLVLSDDRDTLTAVGQTLAYTGQVRNARGNPVPGYSISWSSTNPAAATVAPGGVVTATGFGTAFVIGQAGGFADTVTDVVTNPTRLIVDNGVAIAPRFGTRKRPYLRIGDGVNVAEVDDTVLVRRGTSPYAETVALTRRVTVLGDDSAFVAGGQTDPLLLPLVSHDTGAAGITAYTTATVVIKNLALRHTTSGPAIDARKADLRVARFYVNPPGTVAARIGRGIALDSAASATASITGSEIHSVRGFGIRVRDGTSVVIDTVYVESVDSMPGVDVGAGIRIQRGSGITVRHATVRGTQGPEIQVDSSANATIASNDLAGRQRLLLVRWSTGATIQSNTFDTRPLGLNGEVYSGGTLYEWSGLEMQSSWQAVVTGNSFRDVAAVAQEPFNAMRFVQVRSPSFPFTGAQILSNGVLGARSGIRSENSNLTIQGSRFDSTLTGVIGTGSDALALQSDTVNLTLQGGCVQASSASSISLTASWFQDCTAGGSAAHAVSVGGGFFWVQQSTFVNNRGGVIFSGISFTATGNTVSGAGFSPVPGDTLAALAALDATAAALTIVQNTVTGHRYNAGIRVEGASFSMRLDSNLVSTNSVGVRLGSLSNFSATNNDIFDNAPAGVVNEVATAITMPSTWWGDARGPRRLADPTATGDSLSGNVTAASWNAAALANGTPAAEERKVRGDGQTGVRGTALAKAFTVRVVDAAGRPVSGVSVRFKVISGGGSFGGAGQINITTNASGLAEATLTLGANPGTNTATVTLGGLTVTFTATGT